MLILLSNTEQRWKRKLSSLVLPDTSVIFLTRLKISWQDDKLNKLRFWSQWAQNLSKSTWERESGWWLLLCVLHEELLTQCSAYCLWCTCGRHCDSHRCKTIDFLCSQTLCGSSSRKLLQRSATAWMCIVMCVLSCAHLCCLPIHRAVLLAGMTMFFICLFYMLHGCSCTFLTN